MSILIDKAGQLPSEINSINPHELCDYLHNIQWELNFSGEEFVHLIKIDGDFPKGIYLTDDTSGIISGNLVPLDSYHEVRNYVLKKLKNMGDSGIPYPNCYKSIDDPNNLEPLTVKDILEIDGHHYSGRTWGSKGHLAYTSDEPSGDLTKFFFTLELKTKIPDLTIELNDVSTLRFILPDASDEWLVEIESGAVCNKVYDVIMASDPEFEPEITDPEDPEYVEYIPMDNMSAPILVEGLDLESDDELIEEIGTADVFMVQRQEFYIQAIAVWDPAVFCVAYGDSTKSLKNDDGEILSGEDYVTWRKSQGHKYPAKC